ncbi:MAG: hypothetical protein ACXWKG_07685 [Limisphaerales bacterium]
MYFSTSSSMKRYCAVLGLVFLSLAIIVAALTAISPQELAFVINYFFVSVFMIAGGWLLRLAAKEKNTIVKITSDGVAYGTQLFSWNEIAEVGVMSGRKEFYCRPRSASIAFEFAVSTRPTAAQIRQLFAVLEREVVQVHPHVRLRNDDEK